jgi:hypothetical protein
MALDTMTKKAIFLILVLILLLSTATAAAITAWTGLGDTKISVHGFLALGLGVLATFGLGAGLMFLVFYSNRRGYDDEADHWRDKEP